MTDREDTGDNIVSFEEKLIPFKRKPDSSGTPRRDFSEYFFLEINKERGSKNLQVKGMLG